MKELIGHIVWLVIAVMVAYTIVNPESGFGNIAALAIWAISIVLIVLSVIAIAGAGLVTTKGKPEHIAKLREAFCQKRSALYKAVGWTKLIVMAALCAYTGMLATGVVYLAAGLIAAGLMGLTRTMLEDLPA